MIPKISMTIWTLNSLVKLVMTLKIIVRLLFLDCGLVSGKGRTCMASDLAGVMNLGLGLDLV